MKSKPGSWHYVNMNVTADFLHRLTALHLWEIGRVLNVEGHASPAAGRHTQETNHCSQLDSFLKLQPTKLCVRNEATCC